MEARHLLLWIAQRFKGYWPDMYDCVKDKIKPDIPNEKIVENAKNFQEKFVTILDDEFPQILKKSTDGTVPFILFYRGDISLLSSNNPKLAVLGSRKSSKYGETETSEIVKGLKDNTIIVSGGARGIDTCGIRSALDSNKKVIIVMGTAIDTYYPHQNEELFNEVVTKGGVIITEYPPQTPISQENFRWRNRIVASIADVIMIGESYERSGCSITIGYGLNFGKTICCVPYPAGIDSFCNQLIKDGATMVENSEDVQSLLRN